jgi:hypothetical protein
MERTQVVSEYFKLRDYLNRGFKLSNLSNKVFFSVEEINLFHYGLYAVSEGKGETHRMLIAERSRTRHWERSGFTDLVHLEEFCADELNTLEMKIGIPIRSINLTPERLNSLSKVISRKLQMLLLNQSYEP